MASRFHVRARILARAAIESARSTGKRRAPRNVRRALVLHHPQMLGDTLLMTPILAKLRERYPMAEIVLITSPQAVGLYEKRPYGVQALSYNPRQRHSFNALLDQGGFDLAIVPGDNRYGWLARALRANWIVGFDGDHPRHKNWSLDKRVPYPNSPAMWGDMAAQLIDGPAPQAYKPADWPAPRHSPFAPPGQPYCVLHLGASTALKLWPTERWAGLAEFLAARGLTVAWSAGPGEQSLVEAADPRRQHCSYAGELDLTQLWHLVANAEILISPDTGIAHLGRLTGTPTVTLFGPGSDVLCGAGEFWRNSPYRAVIDADFPCRDQQKFFRRTIPWVKRCGRSVATCPTPGACMRAIEQDAVERAALELLGGR
jgi:ADP-heptose:LPS heptosyltransferase